MPLISRGVFQRLDFARGGLPRLLHFLGRTMPRSRSGIRAGSFEFSCPLAHGRDIFGRGVDKLARVLRNRGFFSLPRRIKFGDSVSCRITRIGPGLGPRVFERVDLPNGGIPRGFHAIRHAVPRLGGSSSALGF